MKNKWWMVVLLGVFFPGLMMAAEAAGEAVEVVATVAADQWQLALIPVLTPLIVAGVKLLVPKIPKLWLPILAPILGMLVDLLAHFAAGTDLNVWVAAGLGLAGVGVREAVDQVKKATAGAENLAT